MYKYKAIKVYGVKIDEHRLVMENHLGRKLNRTEVVHHIDGDPRNNKIENLSVMSLVGHSSLHGFGKETQDVRRQRMQKKSVWTKTKTVEAKKLLSMGLSTLEVAFIMVVGRELIRRVKTNTHWTCDGMVGNNVPAEANDFLGF